MNCCSFFLVLLVFSPGFPAKQGLDFGKPLSVWLDEFLENPTILVLCWCNNHGGTGWWHVGGLFKTLWSLNSLFVKALRMVFSNYDEGRESGITHTENMLPFMLTGKDSILIKQRVASEKYYFQIEFLRPKLNFLQSKIVGGFRYKHLQNPLSESKSFY